MHTFIQSYIHSPYLILLIDQLWLHNDKVYYNCSNHDNKYGAIIS